MTNKRLEYLLEQVTKHANKDQEYISDARKEYHRKRKDHFIELYEALKHEG